MDNITPLKLYKAQHEGFTDDLEYYYHFSKGHTTLELFAGYGRVTNFLIGKDINIETVEIEPEFTRFIKLDQNKKYIANVTKFNANKTFDRIFAAYNSFCLLTKNEDILSFFSQIESHLNPGGYIALSYFPTMYWKDAPTGDFLLDNIKIKYRSSFDVSQAKQGHAIWFDEYEIENNSISKQIQVTYPVRVYDDLAQLKPFFQHTRLELVDEVHNFGLNINEISEPGWIDFVFQKNKGLKKYSLVILITIFELFLTSNILAASNPKSVNVLTWWGYLESPEIAKEVKTQCGVTLSYDTYYTNNEFLRRMPTSNNNYDIAIFSNTIFNLIKNELPKSNIDLASLSRQFNPVIRKQYLKNHFSKNIIFFMHSLTGFLWNPNVISITDNDNINSIFQKAENNIVVIIDDPVEISNIIKKSFGEKKSLTFNATTNSLNMSNFKKLIQKATVYTTNNYNQIYDQPNFAFAFAWSGDAIVYMKQAKKSFKFYLHPDLSYISSDLLAALNNRPETACVANVLMSKKVASIVQNNTYYFSPYGNYSSVNDDLYRSIYKNSMENLEKMSWIEPVPAEKFNKMLQAWNQIQLGLHNMTF